MENKELDEDCIMHKYKEICAKAEREAEYWRTQYRELMGEVVYLRGIKHTLEAILGRNIGDEKF